MNVYRKWAKRILCGLLAAVLVLSVVVGFMVAVGQHRLDKRVGSIPNLADGDSWYWQGTTTFVADGVSYAPRDDVFTMLCIGLGSSEQRQTNGEVIGLGVADTFVLVCYDLKTGKLDLLCIPRDTQAQLLWCGDDGVPQFTYPGHLALQYSYGGGTHELCSANTVQTVQSLLSGMQIDAWFTIDMDSIITLADSLDGIPVTVPDDPYYCAYTGYTPGQWVLLRGEAALQFVQYRDVSVFASCEMRIERQKVFLNNLLDSLKQAVFERPWELPVVYSAMRDEYYTDLTLPEIAALAFAARKVSIENIGMQTLPGEVRKGAVYEEFYLDEMGAKQALLNVFYRH